MADARHPSASTSSTAASWPRSSASRRATRTRPTRSAASTSPTTGAGAHAAATRSPTPTSGSRRSRAALGLDLLDAAVLAICAAPELNPRYGRLYAYLQDDVTRKLPSPRLVGHLLAGDGVTAADVMLSFERDGAAAGAAARSGCRATRRRRSPSGRSSSPTGSPRTCSASGWTTRRPAASCAWSRCPTTTRAATRRSRRSRAMLAHPSALPVVLAGPDAEALVAKAYGRPLVVAHMREIDSATRWPRRRSSPRWRTARWCSRDSRTSSPASARACCARSSGAASASSSPRRTATRRSRSATARRC